MRNPTYRSTAEISDQMASRDLKQLVDAGLLKPHGEKRGRFYLASPILREIREKTREPKSVPDPFEEMSAPIFPGFEVDS